MSGADEAAALLGGLAKSEFQLLEHLVDNDEVVVEGVEGRDLADVFVDGVLAFARLQAPLHRQLAVDGVVEVGDEIAEIDHAQLSARRPPRRSDTDTSIVLQVEAGFQSQETSPPFSVLLNRSWLASSFIEPPALPQDSDGFYRRKTSADMPGGCHLRRRRIERELGRFEHVAPDQEPDAHQRAPVSGRD